MRWAGGRPGHRPVGLSASLRPVARRPRRVVGFIYGFTDDMRERCILAALLRGIRFDNHETRVTPDMGRDAGDDARRMIGSDRDVNAERIRSVTLSYGIGKYPNVNAIYV